MNNALRKEDSYEFIKEAKKSPGYEPLVIAALKYAASGITSLSEVFRVSEQIDESPDFQKIG